MSYRSSGSRKIRRFRRFSVLLLSCLLLAALAESAEAAPKKRIVVTKFSGRGDGAQKVVEGLVSREGTLLGEAAFQRSKKKLRIAKAGAPGALGRIAKDLRADAIIGGSVGKAGAEWSLSVTIFDGNGQIADTVQVPL